MSDLLDMAVGIVVPLFVMVATFVGTIAALTVLDSLWGMLLFLTWPFIATGIVMFVLWWGER